MSRSEGQVLEPGLRPLNIRNQTTCSSDIPLHLSSRLCEGDLVPGLALPVERFHPVVQTLSRVHSTGRSQNICRGFYLPNATSPIKRDLFDFRDVLTKKNQVPNCLISNKIIFSVDLGRSRGRCGEGRSRTRRRSAWLAWSSFTKFVQCCNVLVKSRSVSHQAGSEEKLDFVPTMGGGSDPVSPFLQGPLVRIPGRT